MTRSQASQASQASQGSQGSRRTGPSRSRTARRALRVEAPPGPATIGVDGVLLVALIVVALGPLAEAYGGWRWALAGAGGAVGGVLAVLLARRLALGAWPTVLLAAVWYLALGPALAVPGSAIAGVAPGPAALADLGRGVIESWRDSLTAVPPLGSDGVVLVVPFLMALLAATVAATLLWRTRFPQLAAVVVVAVLAAACAFGDRLSPPYAVRAVVLVVALLVWQRFRAVRTLRINWRRRVAGASALIAVAASVAIGANLAVEPTTARAVLRDVVEPPFEPLDYASPLSRYRAYTKDLERTDLFTVTGLPADVPVRLAVMDRFDGVVWNVGGDGESGRFLRVRPPVGEPSGQRIDVRVDDYEGVWVPSLGVTSSASDGRSDTGATGLVGNDSGTLAQIGGVAAGATYTLDAVREPRPTEPEIRAASAAPTPYEPPEQVPEVLVDRAQEWVAEAGAATAGEQALTLTERFHDDGYYSDGLEGDVKSPSGHGTDRLVRLVGRTEMIGNDEQYASAMAVAMQQLGAPARVVLGFTAGDGSPVTGGDVTAWVEVALDGLGWVAFDPTPPKDQQPPDQQQEPEPLPQPQVLQPPDPPQEPEEEEQDPPQGAGTSPETTDDDQLVDTVLGWLGTALKAAALTLPIWLIPLVKLLRRRRRRRRRDPVRRVSGGWREVADRARDLGTPVPAGATRVESGLVLAERFPSATSLDLALQADRHVFGGGQPTAAEVEDYWRDVGTAVRRMRADVPWWRRPLALFSLASIPWRAGASRATQTVRATGARVRSATTDRLRRPRRTP